MLLGRPVNNQRTDSRFHNTYLVIVFIYSFNKYILISYSVTLLLSIRDIDTQKLNNIPSSCDIYCGTNVLELAIIRR